MRRGLAAAAALLAIAATTACGGSGGPTPDAPSPSSGVSHDPGPLSLAVYGPSTLTDAYSSVAESFEAAHPGTKVTVTVYPDHRSASDALQAATTTGQVPDVFLIDHSDLDRLRSTGAVAPVDTLLAEREVDFGDGFQRDALEAFSVDNGLQCMPVDATPLVLYYNTALVDLAEPLQSGGTPVDSETGWTLEEFEQIAERVTAGEVKAFQFDPTLDQLAPFIWSNRGEVVDDQRAPTHLTLSADASADAIEKILEVVRDPNLTWGRKEVGSRTGLQMFLDGRVAMILGYRDLVPVLRAEPGLAFDVMPLPRLSVPATTGRMTALCLSAASTAPERAADFIAYAVSAESAALLAKTGYATPTNLSVLNSDDFLQPGAHPAHANVFPDNIRPTHLFPSVPSWTAVASATTGYLRDMFYDPIIEPLEERLRAIDAASAPLFTPLPTGSENESGAGSGTESDR